MSTYLSIITLHVNGLSASIKRYRGAEWIQKQNPYIRCLQKTDLKTHTVWRWGDGKEYSMQSFHEVCKSHHYAVYLKLAEWYVSIIQSIKLEEKG